MTRLSDKLEAAMKATRETGISPTRRFMRVSAINKLFHTHATIIIAALRERGE
jgi:hypothetical protein